MQPPILLNCHVRKFVQLLTSFVPAARAAWQRYLHRQRLRSTIRQLEGLSDVALKDIGLHRGEITATVMRLGPGSIAEQRADACTAQDAHDRKRQRRVPSGIRHARGFIYRI